MKKRSMEELGRLSVDQFKEARKLKTCLVLDNVRSLHNVGSAFRTADAFLLEKIYLTGITGTPPHREIEKAALGSTASVEWAYAEHTGRLISELKNGGWTIVVVEQTSESIPLQSWSVSSEEKVCLVFGNEVNGVSEEALTQADLALEIPQSGTKHSLNISVCLGIVVWEVFKKQTISR